VRARHAALDSREYHCVDGSVESDYHPYLPDALELPSPESLRTLTLGCKQRGTADQAPFDHATGGGHVAGHAGHYADALAKGRQVVLIVIETTGAVHPDAVGMLYAWHAETRAEGCIDRTVYGTSRTATTSFFTHHLRLISLAAVIGAALPVAIWAKSRKSHLLSGAPLAGLLPVVM